MILAPNHSSFMDHFFLGAAIRRKVSFMAKSQLFRPPLQLIYSHGGVFPVRRGVRDEEAFITAAAILERGGCMAMYCEGGRSRSGRIGDRAKPGIGRLALETGATVVPVAIHGSDAACATGSACEFPKVTVQYGEPFRYERVAEPTREQQQAAPTRSSTPSRRSTPARRRRAPGGRRALAGAAPHEAGPDAAGVVGGATRPADRPCRATTCAQPRPIRRTWPPSAEVAWLVT